MDLRHGRGLLALAVALSTLGCETGVNRQPPPLPTPAGEQRESQTPTAEPSPPEGARGGGATSQETSKEGRASVDTVVRFDDLGISYAIPPGWSVMGDEELTRRLQASDGLRHERDKRELAARISRKEGVPLLTLRSQGNSAEPTIVLLSSVSLPPGTKATEAVSDQRKKLEAAVKDSKLVRGPTSIERDGVEGAELVDVRRDGRDHLVRGTLMLFVRGTKGVLLVINSLDTGSEPSLAVRRMRDGIHFYEPTTSSP